jgi:hypothetical protein
VNQPHNDYLQLLVEIILAGFSIAVWFLVLVLPLGRGSQLESCKLYVPIGFLADVDTAGYY